MPNLNGQGPIWGTGPKTGRQMGNCPRANPVLGFGRGFGRGRGLAWRARVSALPQFQPPATEKQEKEYLKQELNTLKQEMKGIEKRLKELK